MNELFDVGKTWDQLDDVARRRIGSAALIYGLAAMADYEPQAMDAAATEATHALRDAALEFCCPDQHIIPRPNLALIDVRACDGCGCTDRYGCLGGCHWVGERQCSACVPPSPPAPSSPDTQSVAGPTP